MTELVINKKAVIKQLSAGTAGVINAHDQHSCGEQLGLGGTPGATHSSQPAIL